MSDNENSQVNASASPVDTNDVSDTQLLHQCLQTEGEMLQWNADAIKQHAEAIRQLSDTMINLINLRNPSNQIQFESLPAEKEKKL